MKDKVEIVPAILATDEGEYKEKIEKILAVEELREGWVQIDLADGKFVKNTTIGLDIIKKHPIQLKKEAHLMVIDPINWIDELVGFNRVIFHLETENINEVIDKIKSRGWQAGIAVNPETPIDRLTPFIDRIDLVLIMGVHPGFGGQKFIPAVIDKVQQTDRLRLKNSRLVIEVDGGVSERVIKDLIKAGATSLVLGSRLTNGDISQNLETIWEYIYS